MTTPSSVPAVSFFYALCVRIFSPFRPSSCFLRFVSVLLVTAALTLASGCPRPAPTAAASTIPRIVSLAPNLTEIVCAIGAADCLVGRTEVCNHPSNLVARVPVVGGFGRPWLEPLLEQKPTLVLSVDLEDKSLDATFDRLGIVHRQIACRQLREIPAAIRTVGQLAGRGAVANDLARAIESDLRRAAAEQPPLNRRPRVFIEIWGDPLMTAGRHAFVSELVTLAGGRNLGDELPGDFAIVSPEWVLQRNPDVILCLYPGVDHSARKAVLARLGWQSLHAAQQGRVQDEFYLDPILRPGPRVLEGVKQIRQAIEKNDTPKKSGHEER